MELSEFRYKLRGPAPTGPRNRAERRAAGRPVTAVGEPARNRDKKRRRRLAAGSRRRNRRGG